MEKLSELGHFLKGSSATLGFVKIKDQCEKIQQWGLQKDETGTEIVDDKNQLLKWIGEALSIARRAFRSVRTEMEDFYNES